MGCKTICAYCGKEIEIWPCKLKKRNFCSRECVNNFASKSKNPDGYMNLKSFEKNSKRFKQMNEEWNKTKMTEEVRAKIRESRTADNPKSYPKIYGIHHHRIQAEKMLGRELKKGEVVHHIDGNKANYNIENLIVFSSQAVHSLYHSKYDRKKRRCCQ